MHVAILCEHPNQHRAAHMAIQNIVSVSRPPLAFHLLSAGNGLQGPIESSMTWSPGGSSIQVYDLDRLPADLERLESEMETHTQGENKPSLYKPLLHMILPATLDRVIVWDVDVFTLGDVRKLWDEFGSFKNGQLIGAALEQQPTYYNWWPQEGSSYFRGYNDGVQLLDLSAMRRSSLYNGIVAAHRYGEWLPDKTDRFSSGGLGDQDFYAVLGHQHPELFHVLPCGWNRQLCEYWLRQLPAVPFEACPWESVHVLHGNCDGHWNSPCSIRGCSEDVSASGLVAQLLHAKCGSSEVRTSLANLGLPAPNFNCSKAR